MKILVAAGGLSPERDVSLTSGTLIANALMENGHSVAFADIYEGIPEESLKKGPEGIYFNKESGKHFSYKVPGTEPDIEAIIRANGNRRDQVGPGFLDLCKSADTVFVALHGGIGENGVFQALLETYGIKHTGSGSEGCTLSMDKSIAKTIAAAAGIKTPAWEYFPQEIPVEEVVTKTEQKIGFPCVIKPCGCGSSIGVTIAAGKTEAEEAVEKARQYGTACMAEKLIRGREFSCGVLEEESPDGERIITALPPVEIIPKSGFYGYADKYQAGLTREICPAEIPPEYTEKLQKAAATAHKVLRLKTYSRSDFILDKNGNPWWLEINSLPGMTPTSLVPQEAAAIGINYNELCERIIKASLR